MNSIEQQGVFKGKRLKNLGPNDLSKLKGQAKDSEKASADVEDYERAAYYRDKYREIQRHLDDALEPERR